MGTATFLRQLKKRFRGDARLYRLDPPVKCSYDPDDTDAQTAEYVVVSACVPSYSKPETYIFASDERGCVTSWSELSGSMSGVLDHRAALNSAGYEVVE